MAGHNAPLAGFTIRDYNGETSNFAGRIPPASLLNLVGLLGQVGTFRDAMQDLILGTVVKEYGDFYNTVLGNEAPTDPNAQRERKILVFYEDVTEYLDAPLNLVYNPNFRAVQRMEIPTARVTDPDDDELLVAGTESYDFTNSYVIAFVDAFEAFFKSDGDGAVNVIDMQLVGRNL